MYAARYAVSVNFGDTELQHWIAVELLLKLLLERF